MPLLCQRRQQRGGVGARSVGQPEQTRPAAARRAQFGERVGVVARALRLRGDRVAVARRRSPAGRRRPSPRPRCARWRRRRRTPASTTSGAPLTDSSLADTDAENGRPDRNGRVRRPVAASVAADLGGRATTAASVACSWRSPLAAAWPAPRTPAPRSSENPRGRRTAVTRNRFSLNVPVLSKHTTSTRPSASTERGLRTSAPALVSRRAEACCASVATSGRPSGTAATATATPLATACAQRDARAAGPTR